jgi:tyrosine decarboxylase/aspartate 1-decarboxylase
MKIRERGLSPKEIDQMLDRTLQDDLTFTSGRIVGSMCTEPARFARRLYSKYLEKNLGDPGLFPGTAKLEAECIATIGNLLSHPNAAGSLVSGGTEANIMALWSAKKNSKVERPEAVVPISAHHSFDKAADLLGVKLVKILTDDMGRVDVKKIKPSITPNTIMMLGVAGTTDLGVMDPMAELSEIAEAENIPLHVDASFGGFVIPFLRELGYDVEEFDFRLAGVSSISIDPHKMGMAPLPAGTILFRDAAMLERIKIVADYLAGGEASKVTLLGTRPGTAAIVVWAMFNLLGMQGYRRIVKRCMDLTYLLYEESQRMNSVKPVQEPTMNILGLKPLRSSPQQVSKELRVKGWAVSAFPKHLRVCIMPHVRKKHILEFSKTLDLLEKTEKLIVRSRAS